MMTWDSSSRAVHKTLRETSITNSVIDHFVHKMLIRQRDSTAGNHLDLAATMLRSTEGHVENSVVFSVGKTASVQAKSADENTEKMWPGLRVVVNWELNRH